LKNFVIETKTSGKNPARFLASNLFSIGNSIEFTDKKVYAEEYGPVFLVNLNKKT
jgi:hypothetical protein